MSKTQKSAAIILLGKGLTQAETARKLGLSRQIVSHWMKSQDFQREVEISKINFVRVQESQQESQQEKKQELVVEVIPPPYESSKTLKCILRERELDLLQKIEESMLPQLSEGGTRAAAILLKLSQQRTSLLGLEIQNWDAVQAIQVLVDENCIPSSQIIVASAALDEMNQKLKTLFLPPEKSS